MPHVVVCDGSRSFFDAQVDLRSCKKRPGRGSKWETILSRPVNEADLTEEDFKVTAMPPCDPLRPSLPVAVDIAGRHTVSASASILLVFVPVSPPLYVNLPPQDVGFEEYIANREPGAL